MIVLFIVMRSTYYVLHIIRCFKRCKVVRLSGRPVDCPDECGVDTARAAAGGGFGNEVGLAFDGMVAGSRCEPLA